MKSGKYLHSFTEEGIEIRTQLRTKNNWETFHVWNGWTPTRGYRGTYKGKNRKFRNYCSPGMVRHHERYDDNDILEGVILVTRSEHAMIHKHPETGKFMSYKKRRY